MCKAVLHLTVLHASESLSPTCAKHLEIKYYNISVHVLNKNKFAKTPKITLLLCSAYSKQFSRKIEACKPLVHFFHKVPFMC